MSEKYERWKGQELGCELIKEVDQTRRQKILFLIWIWFTPLGIMEQKILQKIC